MKGILNEEYELNDNSTLPIGTEVEMPRPKEIGKAIDTAIEYIKKNEKLEEI